MKNTKTSELSVFDEAYLIPISMGGSGNRTSGIKFPLRTYRWVDLKNHKKLFLIVLLAVNLIANCLFIIIVIAMTLVINFLLSSGISLESYILLIPILLVNVLLLLATHRGIKSCIRLARYIRTGF